MIGGTIPLLGVYPTIIPKYGLFVDGYKKNMKYKIR
jgi:hypothetical protein